MSLIFNSLGSNYSFKFVKLALKQLVWWGDAASAQRRLHRQLRQRFERNNSYLTYKGRDAIELALKGLGIQTGDAVITQAFSCHAIEQAILRAGAEVVFVDLDPATFNPSLKLLQKKVRSQPNVKAIIIQHTLGQPADISSIAEWCQAQKIWLIEDLAQAIGGSDPQTHRQLGSFGDATVLSFGRDKIVDAVSGGAVLFLDKHYKKARQNLAQVVFERVPWWVQMRDLLYPSVTWKVRNTYRWQLGKLIHRFAKLVKLEVSPVGSPLTKAAPLPARYAELVLFQLSQLEQQVTHRRAIARLYHEQLGQNLPNWTINGEASPISQVTQESTLENATHQRYLLAVSEPDNLIKFVQQKGIYISDRWYRQPVDAGSLPFSSSYVAGSCPVAERLATMMVNLPTHRFINLQDVATITEAVKDYVHHTDTN